jgi:putative ABC transport system ATP-binding protein
MSRVVELSDLHFTWPRSTRPVLSLDALQVNRQEHLFIKGPSGSGKSTLLGLLAGILIPQHGRVSVLGRRLETLGGSARDRFRADHIGYIFQLFNLIPYLSVVENIILPCHFSPARANRIRHQGTTAHQEALRLLAHLKLTDPALLCKPVNELSVGQQQRVAAARALIGAPELVIGDEPTSSLDSEHRTVFIKLLFDECARTGATLIFVSHEISLAGLFGRTLNLPEINRVQPSAAEQ